MNISLPEEFGYTHICEDGRELHFICTNEALRELAAGYLASENANEPKYREIKTRYAMEYLRLCLNVANSAAVKYRETGGMHFSAVFNQKEMLSFFEDIGRHNSVDKVLGDCVLREIDTDDAILMTSGRVSSEIVKKAGLLGVSVIASQSKAMLNAYQMAERANITLIGYLGKSNVQVYCTKRRISGS